LGNTPVSDHFFFMAKFLLIFISIISTFTIVSQNKMRTIDELINKENPGRTLVNECISKAKNKVEALPLRPGKIKKMLCFKYK
jgi:hypothetical protein